jgi:branched-chain amino acid transport system permease protein
MFSIESSFDLSWIAITAWFSAVATIPGMVWLQQIFLGMVNASVLVTLSLGLTIIMGLMRIVNFAHGVFFTLGAYLGWAIIHFLDNFWIAFLIVPILGIGLGYLTEVTLLRRTYGKKESEFLGILVTFGLFLATPDLLRWIFGNSGLPFPTVMYGSLFTITGLPFSAYRCFIVACAAVLTLTLWYILQKTDLGMIIRAGTSNHTMVEVLGINIRSIWSQTFALGVATACFAGILVSPVHAVEPLMGGSILIQSFIVVIIGGLGSFWGTVLTGLVVGQLLTLFPLLPGATRWADVLIYAIAAFMLITRPRGLFGIDIEK